MPSDLLRVGLDFANIRRAQAAAGELGRVDVETEVARRTEQALQRRPDLAALYTTGYTADAVLHRGILDCDVKSLNKPYNLAELVTTMRDVLDSRA